MVGTKILDIDTSNAEFEESITRYEFHSHSPYNNSSFGNNDEIRIPIKQSDVCTLPSESYIHLSGKLMEVTDTGKKYNGALTLCEGFAFHLFNEIRFEINGAEIDRVRNPRITCMMKNIVTIRKGQVNALDTSAINLAKTNYTTVNATGEFFVEIPLKFLFGFCDDYERILVGVKMELILNRSSNDANAVVFPLAEKDKNFEITITDIKWRMPFIELSDECKLSILKLTEQDYPIHMAFRKWELHEYPILPSSKQQTWVIRSTNQMEKPRYVFIGFQTKRRNNKELTASNFDKMDLKNVRLYLNSVYYPYENYQGHTMLFYNALVRANQTYYMRRDSEPAISGESFLSHYPIYVIDCNYQNDSIKTGAVDVRLEFETGDNIPAETSAYCLLIHDCMMTYTPLSGLVRTI